MYVYKITNKIDEKCYIGITEEPVERYKQHIRESKMARSKNRKLYQAIEEFGIENFKFEIIEQTNDDTREEYWITFFDSKQNGYNHTENGKANRICSNVQLKTTIDEEDKKTIIEMYKNGHSCRKIRNVTNISERKIQSMVKSLKRNPNSSKLKTKRVVLKIDMSGNVVDKYCSVREAIRQCGYGKNGILKVLAGTRKTAGGYYWKYGD